MIHSKTATIKWAKANGVRFVFSKIDGLGKKVFWASNEAHDRSANLVWEAA
jgi:hypothetical protein